MIPYKKYLLLFFCIILGPNLFSQSKILFIQDTSFQEIFKKAKKERKLIFVYISIDNCAGCFFTEVKAFPDIKVGNFYNSNFISIKYKIPYHSTIQLNKPYKTWIYPSYLFIDTLGNIVYKGTGGARSSDLMGYGKMALHKNFSVDQLMELYNKGERSNVFLWDLMNKIKFKNRELTCIMVKEYSNDVYYPVAPFDYTLLLYEIVKYQYDVPASYNYNKSASINNPYLKKLQELMMWIEKSNEGIDVERQEIKDDVILHIMSERLTQAQAKDVLSEIKIYLYNKWGKYDDFIKETKLYYKESNKIDDLSLYRASAFIVKNTNKIEDLELALKWALQSYNYRQEEMTNLNLKYLYGLYNNEILLSEINFKLGKMKECYNHLGKCIEYVKQDSDLHNAIPSIEKERISNYENLIMKVKTEEIK